MCANSKKGGHVLTRSELIDSLVANADPIKSLRDKKKEMAIEMNKLDEQIKIMDERDNG